MAGGGAAEHGAAIEAKAVFRRRAIRELHGRGEAGVERRRVVTRRVDMALPGDHVVQRGAQAGVPGPLHTVFCRPKAGRLAALITLGAIRHGAGVGSKERAGHARRVEQAGA